MQNEVKSAAHAGRGVDMSSANLRIQWLHRKIADNSYPNAKRLSERFGISHRQAQRDIFFLKNKLGAPLEYDYRRRGFYYASPFALPVAHIADNDENFSGVLAAASAEATETPEVADRTVIQTQLPYTAVVRVEDKLAVLELQPYVKERNKDGTYLCEFHSIEKFMSAILALNADIKIIKPDWLRRRLIHAAERIIRNNKE
jgi:predicted DNA-binding transcriptional regulator YafY